MPEILERNHSIAAISLPCLNYSSIKNGRERPGDGFACLQDGDGNQGNWLLLHLTLATANAVLHTSGLLLLIALYRRGRPTIQMLYLLNIALTEALMNYTRSIYYGMRAFAYTFQYSTYFYLHIFIRTGIYYMYFFSMFFLTLDRLLSILLHIRYPIYWSKTKTKLVIVCTWALNLILTLVFCLLYHFCGLGHLYYVIIEVSHGHIPSALNILFLVFAFLSYLLMFWKFSVARRESSQGNSSESLFDIFRNSKFFVSILLISTFLLLTVFPNLLATCESEDFVLSWGFRLYFSTSILLSDTADAVIYIFMHKPVWKILSVTVRRLVSTCYKGCWDQEERRRTWETTTMLPVTDSSRSSREGIHGMVVTTKV